MRGARRVTPAVAAFFLNHGFGIVTTLDADGEPHHACKGVVDINTKGYVYLIDLYRAHTYRNLRRDCRMTLTAVDEHAFQGYSLKGVGRVVRRNTLAARVMQGWEKKLNHRLTRRIIRNIREDKKIDVHPEALFPEPEYVIVMKVEEILNLNPPRMRRAAGPPTKGEA